MSINIDNFNINSTLVDQHTIINTEINKYGIESKLTGSDTNSNDYFGNSVAIYESRMLVGSFGKSSNKGSAFIFKYDNGWSEEAIVRPSDLISDDYYGQSVALTDEYAAIGAYGANSDTGCVYIFKRSDTTWTQYTKLQGSDSSTGDYFGFSVAMEGSTLCVGARDANSQRGAVYIFQLSGVVWTQQAKLQASDGSDDDQFGTSIDINTNYIVVGANNVGDVSPTYGTVYVYSRSTLLQVATVTASSQVDGSNFGESVKISTDSNYLLVGAPVRSSGGAIHFFTRSGNIWTERQVIRASDAASNDNFGNSLAADYNFNHMAVGSYYDDHSGAGDIGTVYLYRRTGRTWYQTGRLVAYDGAEDDEFGVSVGISNNGQFLMIGADWNNSNAGAIYAYNTNNYQNGASRSTVDTSTDASIVLADYTTALVRTSSTVANYAITLPKNKHDGDVLKVFTASAITTSLSFTPSVVGYSTTSLAENGSIQLMYIGATNSWYKI